MTNSPRFGKKKFLIESFDFQVSRLKPPVSFNVPDDVLNELASIRVKLLNIINNDNCSYIAMLYPYFNQDVPRIMEELYNKNYITDEVYEGLCTLTEIGSAI